MTNKERVEEIDIAKGIGMILVISGHLCENDAIRKFIYSFHMPLFFILVGLVYDINKDKTCKIVQIKKLTVKYIEWSGIYLVFDFIVRYIIEGTRTKYDIWNEVISTVSFYGVSVLWFLSALIIALVFALLIGKRNNYIMCMWGGGIYFIGAMCSTIILQSKDGKMIVFAAVTRGVVAFSWLLIGMGIQRALLKWIHEYRMPIVRLVLLWVAIYFISNMTKPIEYSGLQMGNPIASLALGIMGCISTLQLSKYITQTHYLKRWLLCFGRNSFFVMVTHQYLHINKIVEVGVSLFIRTEKVRIVAEIFGLCVVEYMLSLCKQKVEELRQGKRRTRQWNRKIN